MLTVPTSAGSGVTEPTASMEQSADESLSSTRSTVVRPARTPNSSAAACGGVPAAEVAAQSARELVSWSELYWSPSWDV